MIEHKEEGKARPRLPRVARNVFSNWGTYILSFAVNFFLAPFIVRHLGQTGYGVWTLMISLTGYLGLLDLGVRSAVTRFVARYHTAADHDEASRITSSALTIFITAGVLAVSASVVLAFTVVQRFKIDPAYLVPARAVLILSGLNVGISLVSGVFSGTIVSLQRFDLVNRVEILNVTLRALVIFFVLRAGGGIVALASIQFASSVLVGLALAGTALRLYPELRLRFVRPDRQRLSLIFSFSIYAFLIHASLQLIYYTDAVVISAFLPIGMVTFFAIASNLMSYARALLTGISSTLTPMASSLEAVNKSEELRRLALNASRYAASVMFPIAITFMLRGRTFIGMWMGRDYAELSGAVLRILVLAWLFGAGNAVTGSILMGISKHKALVPMAAGEGLANLGLSVALVRPLGILGVAWGTTIPNLAQNILVYPWYLCRTLGIPWQRYAVFAWGRPATAMVPFAVLTYLVEQWWPVSNLLLFFAQVALVFPSALLGFWFFTLEPAERSHHFQGWILPLLRSWGRSSAD